jgi:hypothetical protein
VSIPRAWILLAVGLTSCSSSTTSPSSSTVTPSSFVMTWPTLAFAQTPVGMTAPAPVVITLSNYGAVAVPVGSVSDSDAGEFPFTTTCAVGGSLAPNSTCAVTAQFSPSTTGARTATLSINANSTTQSFTLTGTGVTGVKPQLSIDLISGPPSTIFTLTVSGATPGGTLTLNTIYTAQGSPGVLTTSTGWIVDSSGNATMSTNSDDLGSYESWVVDLTTGISSNHVTHTVQ